MNILLLEPNRLLANQYVSFLTRQGHQVAWREDAQTGITAADEQRPDVVIAELLLGGHSGIEFLYEFRSYGDWVAVPAIILSNLSPEAAGLPPTVLESLGVAMYLYKPELSLQKLAELLSRLLPTQTVA